MGDNCMKSGRVAVCTTKKSAAIVVISVPFRVNGATYQQLKQTQGYNFGGLSETAMAYASKLAVEAKLHKDLRSREQYQVAEVCGGVSSDGTFNIILRCAPSRTKIEAACKAAAAAMSPQSTTVIDLCKKMCGEGGEPIKSAAGAFASVADKFASALGKAEIYIVGKVQYKDGKDATAKQKLTKFASVLDEKFAVAADKLSRVDKVSPPNFPEKKFDPSEFFVEEMNVASHGAIAFAVVDYFSKQNNHVLIIDGKAYFRKNSTGHDKDAYQRYVDGALVKFKDGIGPSLSYYAATITCFSAKELYEVGCKKIKASEIVSALSSTAKSLK